MNATDILAAVATAVSIATALGSVFKGYKKRLEDAAKEPFIAGQAAMNAARAALELKDQQIRDVMDRDQTLHAQLVEAQAARDSQQAQVAQLYTQIGQLRTENELLRQQIKHLEETVEQLKSLLSPPAP